MPVSQGGAGGIPGLNLKAYAYITSAGVLVRGLNITSVTRTGPGLYEIVFTVPMSGNSYVVRMTTDRHGFYLGGMASKLAGSCTVSPITANSFAAVDAPGLWEFYE